jgi:hypothetical protein
VTSGWESRCEVRIECEESERGQIKSEHGHGDGLIGISYSCVCFKALGDDSTGELRP